MSWDHGVRSMEILEACAKTLLGEILEITDVPHQIALYLCHVQLPSARGKQLGGFCMSLPMMPCFSCACLALPGVVPVLVFAFDPAHLRIPLAEASHHRRRL